ncbi:MAG: hypothetical protein ACTSYS_14025 [Promethearchaeota archaeon]
MVKIDKNYSICHFCEYFGKIFPDGHVCEDTWKKESCPKFSLKIKSYKRILIEMREYLTNSIHTIKHEMEQDGMDSGTQLNYLKHRVQILLHVLNFILGKQEE